MCWRAFNYQTRTGRPHLLKGRFPVTPRTGNAGQKPNFVFSIPKVTLGSELALGQIVPVVAHGRKRTSPPKELRQESYGPSSIEADDWAAASLVHANLGLYMLVGIFDGTGAMCLPKSRADWSSQRTIDD